ncbi:MAG: vWA domain-containing protein [Halolamina sp.]|uniref:vWA domain-containing protein n=1 Tax=Halolamina sp. TaxID=1940283 RepID=UPI002FC32113
MTDDPITISRRKILASLGAIGVASTGTGIGTAAYFNDTERFGGNTLTAGEFDLKVDWQQSYYRGLAGQNPDDHATWQNVNAYPDAGINGGTADDGVQDPLFTRDTLAYREYGSQFADLTAEQRAAVETLFRAQFADLPDDFESPVIELDDVKPGDKGEITLSFHLFDNPGYIWLGGELTENAENSVNDPESNAASEDQSQPYDEAEWDTYVNENGGVDDFGELADAIDVELWYDDNCNNRFDDGRRPSVQFVLDATDSMDDIGFGAESGSAPTKRAKVAQHVRNLLSEIESAGTLAYPVGVLAFGQVSGTDYVGVNLAPTTDEAAVLAALSTYESQVLGNPGAGTSILDAGIQAGDTNLAGAPVDDLRTMVIVTNGINTGTDPVASASTALRSNGGEVDQFHTVGVRATGTGETALQNIAALTNGQYFGVDRTAWIDDAFGFPEPRPPFSLDNSGQNTMSYPETLLDVLGTSGSIGSDTMIAAGSLREVLTHIAAPEGVLLDADRETGEAVDCYPASETSCVALKWELPAAVENEVQTDSVTVELDFYAEQCRHNDGSNTAPFA